MALSSPVYQVLPELSAVTHLSWVALHGTTHSFIELDKAVVHVISLVSFLCFSLQYSCLENPTNSMKRQNDMTLKDEIPRSVDAQYATGEEWRNNSRNNEKTEPK